MHLSSYLGLLETGCATLSRSYHQVANGHADGAGRKAALRTIRGPV